MLASAEIREEEWRGSDTHSQLVKVIRQLQEADLAALVKFATGRYEAASHRAVAKHADTRPFIAQSRAFLLQPLPPFRRPGFTPFQSKDPVCAAAALCKAPYSPHVVRAQRHACSVNGALLVFATSRGVIAVRDAAHAKRRLIPVLVAYCPPGRSFNTVDLPDYGDADVLNDKLLQAIRGVEQGIGLQ